MRHIHDPFPLDKSFVIRPISAEYSDSAAGSAIGVSMIEERVVSNEGFYDGPIPAELEAAVDKYSRLCDLQIASEQSLSAIAVPLYQYTEWGGLCGSSNASRCLVLADVPMCGTRRRSRRC